MKTKNICPMCGGTEVRGVTTFTADLGFGVVVVRNVPALICEQCGADWIEDEIAEHLEKTVNEVRRSRRQMNPLAKKVLKTPAALPSLIGKIEELKK